MVTKVKRSTFDTQDNLGYVSLLDMAGAAGDGVTDNTAAFAAAIATGLPIFIPIGTYAMGPVAIPANRIVFGEGDLSVLKLKNAANATFITMGSGSHIRSLAIDGNKTNQVGTGFHGLLASDALESTITDTIIYNTKGDCINVTGAALSRILIQSCRLLGFLGSGLTIEQGGSITVDCVDVYRGDGAASPGVGYNISSAGSAASLIILTNCKVSGMVGQGFLIKGLGSKNITDITMNGCVASNNALSGFHLQSTERVTVSGCISNGNTVDGFRLEGDVQYCRINQCVANGNTSYGFREVTSGSTPNYNGFMFEVSTNNGTNTVTKVGANSTVFSV